MHWQMCASHQLYVTGIVQCAVLLLPHLCNPIFCPLMHGQSHVLLSQVLQRWAYAVMQLH